MLWLKITLKLLMLYNLLRAATHEDFESKIGRLEYSIGKYERLIRVTGKEDEKKFYYLLLLFDLNFNVMDVIENKVMPFIKINTQIFR
jgi:hypothetical protein